MLSYDMAKRRQLPLYEHLYRCIKDDILTGNLAPDDRLPSKRRLAEHLGISLITVEGDHYEPGPFDIRGAEPRPTALARLLPVLARGDRRLGKLLETVWRKGGRLDSWSEYFSFERWMEAFAETGIDPDFYALRERPKDEILPWSMIDIGVHPEYLWREREQAYRSVITPDCRVQCMGCGADRLLECGKCDEALTRRERAERGEV